MVVQFPCRACKKSVNKNHHALLCNLCGTWIHLKCNKLSKKDYTKLMLEDDNEPFLCLCCLAENIPFSSLNDHHFNLAVTKGINFLFDEDENDLQVLSKEQLNSINKFKEAFKKNLSR